MSLFPPTPTDVHPLFFQQIHVTTNGHQVVSFCSFLGHTLDQKKNSQPMNRARVLYSLFLWEWANSRLLLSWKGPARSCLWFMIWCAVNTNIWLVLYKLGASNVPFKACKWNKVAILIFFLECVQTFHFKEKGINIWMRWFHVPNGFTFICLHHTGPLYSQSSVKLLLHNSEYSNLHPAFNFKRLLSFIFRHQPSSH